MTSTPKHIPPRLALYLLERLCDEDFFEEFTGDLEEVHRDRANRSPLVADFRYWIDVFSFVRRRFFRRAAESKTTLGPIMFKNYVRVSWRGFTRNRSYAIVNVAGLGVGLACCLLIALFLKDELAFDRFHENSDRIYRVVSEENNTGRLVKRASTYMSLAPTLAHEFPAVEKRSRIYPYPALLVDDTGRKHQEDGLMMVDSTFLEMFSFGMVVGDPTTALDAPFSLVITETTANRIFGRVNPIGKVVEMRVDRGSYDFTITGVTRDVPVNSHFSFDALGSMSSLGAIAPHVFSWYWPPVYSYVMLHASTNAKLFEEGLPVITEKYLANEGLARTYSLQPLEDIHLYSDLENEIAANGSIRFVYLLAIIGVLILGIGCINFINLATARSAMRSRQVGMRKVLGARRVQLVQQFISESMLTTLIGMIFAIGLVWMFIPAFETLTGRELSMGVLASPASLAILVGLTLVIGLVTGSYPAFFLSSFSPIRVLKGISGSGGRADIVLRRGLVVFQFAITSTLIVGTLVIQKQLSFLQGERLGFDKEHVLVVPLRDTANQISHEALKQEWLRDGRIQAVSASSGYPSYTDGLHDFMVIPTATPEDSVETLILTIDHDFAETYGLEILAGRDFSEDFPSDAIDGFMVNEAAARKFGWIDPIGKELTLEIWVRTLEHKQGKVVGLVRDFQYNSLHHAVDPIIFHIQANSFYNDYISVRIGPGDVSETLAYLKEGWASFNPDRPFEYQFVDEVFDAMYRSDTQLGRMLGSFSLLAILVACLGLFALAAFTTERRKKEIGIRKVMGATASGVVYLLSKDFLKLVALAFVLAVPFSYFAMENWLAGFADRIDLDVSLFLLAGAGALLIGILAVGYQAIRAARTNPASSLQYE